MIVRGFSSSGRPSFRAYSLCFRLQRVAKIISSNISKPPFRILVPPWCQEVSSCWRVKCCKSRPCLRPLIRAVKQVNYPPHAQLDMRGLLGPDAPAAVAANHFVCNVFFSSSRLSCNSYSQITVLPPQPVAWNENLVSRALTRFTHITRLGPPLTCELLYPSRDQ